MKFVGQRVVPYTSDALIRGNTGIALKVAVIRPSVIGGQRVASPPKERGSDRLLALTAAGLRSVATKSIEYSRVEERAVRS